MQFVSTERTCVHLVTFHFNSLPDVSPTSRLLFFEALASNTYELSEVSILCVRINLPKMWETIIENKTSKKGTYDNSNDRIIPKSNYPHNVKKEELPYHSIAINHSNVNFRKVWSKQQHQTRFAWSETNITSDKEQNLKQFIGFRSKCNHLYKW